MPGYTEGYQPQPPYSLSQENFGDDVRGEVQHHTRFAEYGTQYDTQMYSAGPYEQHGVGGSSKSFPAQCGHRVDGFGPKQQQPTVWRRTMIGDGNRKFQ